MIVASVLQVFLFFFYEKKHKNTKNSNWHIVKLLIETRYTCQASFFQSIITSNFILASNGKNQTLFLLTLF